MAEPKTAGGAKGPADLQRAEDLLRELRYEGPLAEASERLCGLTSRRNALVQQLAAVDAETALEAAKLEAYRASTVGNPGLMRRLQERPHDEVLRALAKRIRQGGWEVFRRRGADDKQILTVAGVGWGFQVRHGSYPREAIAYGSKGSQTKVVFADGTKLEGAELAKELRRVMEIPTHAQAAAAAKAKPVTGGGETLAAAAAKKPPAKPAKRRPRVSPTPPRGQARAKAADAKPAAAAAAPAGEPAADDGDADDDAAGARPPAVTAGGSYPAARFGLSAADLEAAMRPPYQHHPDSDLPQPIGPTVWVSGLRYAVVGGSHTREVVTYELHPLAHANGRPAEPWQKRRGKHRAKAPEDVPLDGVRAETLTEGPVVFGADAGRIRLTVPAATVTKGNGAHPDTGGGRVLGDAATWADARPPLAH